MKATTALRTSKVSYFLFPTIAITSNFLPFLFKSGPQTTHAVCHKPSHKAAISLAGTVQIQAIAVVVTPPVAVTATPTVAVPTTLTATAAATGNINLQREDPHPTGPVIFNLALMNIQVVTQTRGEGAEELVEMHTLIRPKELPIGMILLPEDLISSSTRVLVDFMLTTVYIPRNTLII